MNAGFMAKLQVLRDLWGRGLAVTSGARCEEWNVKVGGAPQSYHLLGLAADLQIASVEDGVRLEKLADKAGLGGVGLAKTFIHVDDGPPGRRWDYY